MTRQRYNTREALQRILRLFQGKPIPTDIPGGVTGELLSEDESFSDLAELFAGSLPNETCLLPSAIIISGSSFNPLFWASTQAEQLAAVSYTKLIVPNSIGQIDAYYGEIWTYTGTTTLVSLSADTFYKITGSFHQAQNSTRGLWVRPDVANDRIMVSGAYGTYQITYQATFIGSPDITYAVEPFVNSVAVPQAVSGFKPYASGSAVSVSASGFAYISGTVPVDLRVALGQSGWFRMTSGQLLIRRVSY